MFAFFWQALLRSPCTDDSRINLYPAAPIRLAKVLLAWTIAQEGLIFPTADRQGADLRCRHTATPPTCPTHPTWGAGTQRTVNVNRIRVAPCGTRPCSR